MKLYVIHKWLKKVNDNEPIARWAVVVINELLGNMDIRKFSTGKPYLNNSNKWISWSHDEAYLVVALSEIGEIGVDIESRHLRYDEQLYGWVLHSEEKNKLAQGTLFSEIWTRKEAILKYTGEGISEMMHELNSYEVKDGHMATLFLNELCISVCSEHKEYIETYQIL